MRRFDGKVALVTGAAQGIGLGIAERLCEEGATLFLCDVNNVLLEETAKRLGATPCNFDVAQEHGWIATLKLIEEQEGGLHILVNNAAIEGSPDAQNDLENATLADWRHIFDINAAGTFLACQLAIPLMARSGGGSIINMASVASLVPTPFLAAYGAAVQQLTRSVALHCARANYAIRCNSVHPGHVDTPMLNKLFDHFAQDAQIEPAAFKEQFRQAIPLGSFQTPEDIAALVAFLASDDARFVTGQAIACDGGFTLAN
jgi:3(or 17)beta-hydroxysteroid dehydrogenase